MRLYIHTDSLEKNIKEIDNNKDSNKSLQSRLLLLSFCGLNKENKRGITLIALIITITVLIILVSVATYSGVGVIRQSKLNSFTTEMKMMQSEVNDLYDRYTNGETEVLNLGKDLDSQADKVFTSSVSGITDKTGYRYYDQETIKGLGIEGVENEYFVNVEKRSVVSYDGFEYNGVTYYTLGEVPNGEYNVEYEKNTNKPTFDVSIKAQEDGTYRMAISNVQYDGYINKWQVQYKKAGQDYWSTSEDLSFIVPEKGEYDVRLVNGEIESDIVEYTPTLVKKWTSKIDGNGEEEFSDVEKTSDGGYIAVGYTTSTDISGLTNKGGQDAIIVKYDENGNEQWKKSVGGSKNDRYSGVIEITNGTYIAVGTIYSTDVLDKKGNNIGHGYDWSFNFDNGMFSGSMVASEGVIGKYNSSGDEVSLNVTGLASANFDCEGEGYVNDLYRQSAANIKISGIDKVSDGGYVLTGNRLSGIPSSMLNGSNAVDSCQLAIKYNASGEKITQLINGKDTYGEGTRSYGGLLKGVLESNNNYILFGDIDRDMQNNNLEDVATIGDGYSSGVKSLLLDNQGDFIALEFNLSVNSFNRIYKQNSWKKSDIALKSISKSSSTEFVGISEDNRFLKYSMDDGSVLEEYDVPTYENVYAMEGKEEFILLGSPTDEEGVSITENSGAVIAKYAIE